MTAITMRRNNRVRGAALAAVAVVALAGCANDAPEDESLPTTNEDVVVAFANATSDAATYGGLQATLQSTLDLAGATLLSYDNAGDSAKTFSNLSAMIGEDPDVIVMVNPVADASTRIGQQIEESGIPCIAVNVPIPGCFFFNQDSVPMGQELAEQVAGEMDAREWTGEGTSVLLVGTAALGSLNDVLPQFYAPLAELVPDMESVTATDITTASDRFGTNGYFINTDYSIDAAFNNTATKIQSIPTDQKLIVNCLGDELCVGARQAIVNAGWSLDDVLIMAWGATPDAMKDLMNGEGWNFESANFFSNWGQFIAPMALAVAKGITPPEQTLPPQAIITPDNVRDIFADDGTVKMFPPLPEVSQYLLDEGILQQIGNVQGAN